MTKQQIKDKYKVKLYKDFCGDSSYSRTRWVCMKNNEYICDGWTLKEIKNKLIIDSQKERGESNNCK